MKKTLTNLLPALGLGLLLFTASCDKSKNDVPPSTDNITSGANNDSFTTNINTSLTLNVLANDTMPSGTVTITVTQPQNGTVQATGPGTSPGSYVYTPNQGFTGTDQFTYTVCVGQDCETATVTITVINPSSCTLAAADDQAQCNINAAQIFIDVKDNDQTCGQPVSLSVPAQIPNGTAWVANNMIAFEPATGFSGTTSFNYTISNSSGSSTGQVQVTVIDTITTNPCGNNLVTARFDSAFTTGITPGTNIRMVEIPVLANDDYCPTAQLTVTIVQQGTMGQASVFTMANGQRGIRYITSAPPVYFDELRYKVCAASGINVTCDEALVRVHVFQ